MAPLVVIVEDDDELRELLKRGLEAGGFAVRPHATSTTALSAAAADAPDAIIIDIGLPDADGRDLCQALRAAGIGVPVIFLTARAALSDRLSGFHMGGDDYLVKPFALEELVLRLRAVLRRGNGHGDPAAGSGVAELRLDPAAHAVQTEAGRIDLTPTEFRVLAALSARPGEVVRRRDLISAAWPTGAIVHENTLDSYIARIRRKFRARGEGEQIATAHGVGYKLV